MRKDELLYVHQLLTAVRDDLERRGAVQPAALSAYDDLSVSPVAAHRQKADHERAVLALAGSLAAGLSDGDSTPDADRQELTP
jgi:hypothetical protein